MHLFGVKSGDIHLSLQCGKHVSGQVVKPKATDTKKNKEARLEHDHEVCLAKLKKNMRQFTNVTYTGRLNIS